MKKISLFLLALILCASSAMAQIVDPGTPLQKDSAVRYGKLDNGLTYYIRHNEKPAQRAEFYLVTNVGAIQETKAQDGLAHFLEHMALNGTKNLPGKMMLEYFQKNGVEFGRNINASTGVEQTMYMLNNVPVTRKGIIDTALLIMHDYSAFVTNDPAEVEKERGVIVEEWRTRRSAGWRMHEKSLPYLYKGSKYAECTLIGDKHNLETFDPSEIVKFYKTWYRPDLQAVIVVGDIDVDAIESQLKTLFADIPAKENPEPKVLPVIPDNEDPIIGIITDPEATNTSLQVYFKRDPLPDQYMPLGVAYLNDMIENVISSILNERLDDISKKADAPFIQAYAGIGSFCRAKDALIGQVACKEGEGVSAFAALMKELEKAKRYGFTQAEFDRVKTNTLRNLEMGKDNASSRENGELVYPLIYDFIYGNPYMTPEYEYELAKGYFSVLSVEQINQAVSAFDFSKNGVVIYNSVEKEGLVHPTEAQIAEVLTTLKDIEIQAPAADEVLEPLVDASTLKGSPVKKAKESIYGATEWTLKNGIKVVVKPTDYQKEEVVIRVVNDGGRSIVATEDLPSIEGNVFYLYNNNSGISKFPQSTLTKMLTGKMVNVTPVIYDFSHGVNANGSPKDIETILQLIYLSYAEPRFVEEEFQPAMNQLKAVVPNLVKQPNFIFQTEAIKTMYGSNPRKFVISPEMIEKVDIKTLERVYKSLFSNAAGAMVTIVGNVNLNELKPLVEKYIGSIPTAKKPLKWIDPKTDVIKGKIENHFETEMTTPKTTVGIMVSAKMDYNLENIVLNSAANYILDLIYTESIREEEGGTYGVSASGMLLQEPENSYLLQITFDTNPEKADKLIKLTKEGLFAFAENGPSDDFLAKAKENLLKNVPEDRISNYYWRNILARYYKYGVETDSQYENMVKGLTKENVQKFVKSIVDEGNLIEVVMTPKNK